MGETIKVIWPIDPSHSDDLMDKHLLNFFERLSGKLTLEVQPVTIMSSDYFTASEYFEPADPTALKKHIKADCKAYLEKFSSINTHQPLVLESRFGSQTAEINIFSEFVENYEADFIVMATHGRKGWSRYFLGSFTESFLLHSPVPVFVIGPEYVDGDHLSEALMPVEMNQNTQKFVQSFVEDRKTSFLDNIVFFHKISILDMEDIAWAPTLYGISDYDSEDIAKKAKQSTTIFLEDLVNLSKDKDRFHFDISESFDSVAQVITNAAHKGDFDLLIMRSEAGPLAARILGSVTRIVIRESKIPVLVYPCHYPIKD